VFFVGSNVFAAAKKGAKRKADALASTSLNGAAVSSDENEKVSGAPAPAGRVALAAAVAVPPLSSSAVSGIARPYKRFKRDPKHSSSSSAASADSKKPDSSSSDAFDVKRILELVVASSPQQLSVAPTHDILLDYIGQTDVDGFLIVPDALMVDCKIPADDKNSYSAEDKAVEECPDIKDVIKKAHQRAQSDPNQTERSSRILFNVAKLKDPKNQLVPWAQYFAEHRIEQDGTLTKSVVYRTYVEALWPIIDCDLKRPAQDRKRIDFSYMQLLQAIDTSIPNNLTVIGSVGNTLLHVLSRVVDYYKLISSMTTPMEQTMAEELAKEIIKKTPNHDWSCGTHTMFNDAKPAEWTSKEKCIKILEKWQKQPGHRLQGLDNDKNYSPRVLLWNCRNENAFDGALHAFLWYLIDRRKQRPQAIPYQHYYCMFQALLEKGLHPESRDWGSFTFLQSLCAYGAKTIDSELSYLMASLAIKHGASVRAITSNSGSNLLHLLCEGQSKNPPIDCSKLAALLIDSGISIHDSNIYERTPLILTCRSAYIWNTDITAEIPLIELLINKGANPEARDAAGERAQGYINDPVMKEKILKILRPVDAKIAAVRAVAAPSLVTHAKSWKWCCWRRK